MSAIASFIKLPKVALEGLREAAVPHKRMFGTARDTYHDYLRQHGESVADYAWSGYVLGTLLEYLVEQREIDLMLSEFDELSEFLSKARGTACFVFTDMLKQAYLAKFDEAFSEQELCGYYNEFHSSEEPEAGKPMLDGVAALKQGLSAVDEGSVVVFAIG